MDDWLDSRPALRPDLRLVPDTDGTFSARFDDPVTHDTHRLDGVGLRLATLLDGEHTVRDIILALADEYGEDCPSPIVIREFLDELDERLLLVGERSTRALQAHRARRLALRRLHLGIMVLRRDYERVDPDAVEVRRGLRYECLSCGACCSGRFHVELSDIDYDRLAALDLVGKLGVDLDAHVRRSYLQHDDMNRRQERRFLRHVDGTCAFLADDSLCEIHRHFGYEHKPLGCRIFPFTVVLTPDSAVLQFRPECSTQQVSAVDGPLVEPRRAAIWNEIVAEMPATPSVPTSFELRRDDWCDYRTYKPLEQHWVATTLADGWRAGLDAVAADVARTTTDDPALLRHLALAALDLLADHPRSRTETFDAVLGAGELESVRFSAALRGLLGEVDVRDAAGVLADVQRCQARLLSSPVRDALDRQLDEYVADFLFGKYTFRGLSIASGIGLLVLVVAMTRWSAAWAAMRQEVELDEATFNEAVIAWHSALFNIDDVRAGLLLEHRDALEALAGLATSALP